MTHYTDRPLNAAQLAELEDLHRALDEVLTRLDLINQQLASCVQLLDSLASSQG